MQFAYFLITQIVMRLSLVRWYPVIASTGTSSRCFSCNRNTIPCAKPSDGFEPPYEPYEDPVLPLYDEGIMNTYIYDLKYPVPFPAISVFEYS